MKRFLKILAFLGVAVVAIVVAGIAIIKSQDFNAYRSLIAEQVEAATGRELTIDGDLNLEFSMTPALSVEGVSFANAPWGSRPTMVRLDKLAAVVELVPLLSGDVRVEWLELSGVDLLLETDETGRGNWVFETGSQAESADAGAAGDVQLPVVRSVRMQDVTLTYLDGLAGTERSFVVEEVDLAADGPDSPLELSVEAELDGEAIEVEGTLGPVTALLDNKVFPVQLDGEALGAKIELDGSINRPRNARGYNLSFALSGGSLRAVADRAAGLAGMADTPPLASQPFVFSAVVQDRGERVALDSLSLQIGESDLAGELSLAPASPRLGLEADLRAERFDVSDLVDIGDGDTGEAPKPADGRVFPADPLPLDGLKGVDAAVTVAIGAFVFDNIALDDLTAALTLANGRLTVDPFAVSVDGHTVAGAVNVDAASTPAAVRLSLVGEQIDYGRLIAEATGDSTLAGELDLDADVAGTGQSVRAIMASLDGDLRIVTQDGRIESGALGFLSGDLLGAVPFLGSGEDSRDLKCGVIDFAIKDGIAVPRALVIETGGLNVIGSGEIDLREERLNLLFDPRAKSTSLVKMAEVGVRVGGTFLEPEFGPDTGSVVKNVTSTALGIATGGLSTLVEMGVGAVANAADDTDYCAAALSGEMPEPAASGTTADEPASQDDPASGGGAAEGIGGALDSLFGN